VAAGAHFQRPRVVQGGHDHPPGNFQPYIAHGTCLSGPPMHV
jgi:hypothetical protein